MNTHPLLLLLYDVIAGKGGLIKPITAWIFNRTVNQLAKWQKI